MSRQRPNDADHDFGRVLRQASSGYPELPDHVGDRLDRVLDALPAADTLHADPHPQGGRESAFGRLAERLRPKRVRYALVSAAAAVLVTVGAVAAALQVIAPQSGSDSAGSSEVLAEQQDTARDGDEGAAPSPQEAPAEEADPEDTEAGTDSFAGVATFATGSDYTAEADLVAALSELGGDGTTSDGASGDVPTELADLAAGGEFWQRCQDAIAREYAGLLVAVDFAHYESEPAIMALVQGDSGDLAVALTPACADGVIEQLAAQP
jgi:hypothetical protein